MGERIFKVLKPEKNRTTEFEKYYFRGLLQENLAQLKEIERLKRAVECSRMREESLIRVVSMGEEELEKLKITLMNSEKENERLREKLKRLEKDGPQANGFSKNGSQPKRAEKRRENTPQPEEEVNLVSAEEFMSAVIQHDIDISRLSSNGPWTDFLDYDTFLEIDHGRFKTPGMPVKGMKDYIKVYEVHPGLCPHAHYKKYLTEYSKIRGEPKEINASLSPIISEIWVEFPFDDHLLKNLFKSFQGKVSIEDLKKMITTIIPPPKMTRTTGTRGAVNSRSTMAKVYVPPDTIFSGVVFAELDVSELADDDVASIDFYPGVVFGLNMSLYKLHEFNVPHCMVNFFNGDSEDVLLSDLIPLEAIPMGTSLNLRLEDGTRELISFESLEIRSDLERPPMDSYYILGKVGDNMMSVPLKDVDIEGDKSYRLLKELRSKLFRRNQSNIYRENILPEGTKRRATLVKETPPKSAKKPRLIGKKEASSQIAYHHT